MHMRRETIDEAWVFVGLPQRHAFEALEAIAGQWARFMPRYGEIENMADRIPWGISRVIDAEGRLDYLAAVRVADQTGPVPEGLARTIVAPATYAVFRHAAHVSQIRATYGAIWNEWLPASGLIVTAAPTLERHCATFDPKTGEGGVDIWLPVAV